MEICLYALFVILGLPTTFTGQPACRDNQEEFGFALVGHDYKSVYADHFSRCYFECTSEERCQSVTYLWDQKECKMNHETKKSRPEDYVQNPAATYMENTFRAKKGSKSSIPGHSCREIVLSDNSQGDGEYWIDPTASGRPFTVFCDMTTDEGGWTLVHHFMMRDPSSSNDPTYESNSYQEILPKYNLNHQSLLRHGFSKLKTDMGFTQIRFYCFKKKTGSVFHITTSKNIKGTAVVDFFTVSDTMPEACGSFTRFSDDNSTLASVCDEWGHPSYNRWGRRSYRTDERLFLRPLFRRGTNSNNMTFIYFRVSGAFPYGCDDSDMDVSLGDTWKIFVR